MNEEERAHCYEESTQFSHQAQGATAPDFLAPRCSLSPMANQRPGARMASGWLTDGRSPRRANNWAGTPVEAKDLDGAISMPDEFQGTLRHGLKSSDDRAPGPPGLAQFKSQENTPMTKNTIENQL